MSKLEWDKIGNRCYEAGVDKVVLYLLKYSRYQEGKPWNGVISTNENPSGGEPSAFYADNRKYLNLISSEEFGLSIEAYDYPGEFKECLGEAMIAEGVYISQQKRHHFGLVYRTLIGNDIDDVDYGYKLNIVFDCLAIPSESAHETIGESTEPMTHSWEISTMPQELEGYKPTAKLTLVSKDFEKAGLVNVLHYLEGILFGTDTTNARMPKIPEILEVFDIQMYLRDNDNNALLDSSGNRIRTRVFA